KHRAGAPLRRRRDAGSLRLLLCRDLTAAPFD
ncbi:jg3635, partial [Pararge aegeria aegeria]